MALHTFWQQSLPQPFGRKKIIVKDETGVKRLNGNQEENWAEKQFVNENLAPLRRGGYD